MSVSVYRFKKPHNVVFVSFSSQQVHVSTQLLLLSKEIKNYNVWVIYKLQTNIPVSVSLHWFYGPRRNLASCRINVQAFLSLAIFHQLLTPILFRLFISFYSLSLSLSLSLLAFSKKYFFPSGTLLNTFFFHCSFF